MSLGKGILYLMLTYGEVNMVGNFKTFLRVCHYHQTTMPINISLESHPSTW